MGMVPGDELAGEPPNDVPQGKPLPVEVSFGSAESQRRWTVVLRYPLAIPHLFAISLLSIAISLLAVVGWFAALALGRLPVGLWSFQRGALEYSTRVSAYTWFLLDDYPPFSLQPGGYPVSIDVPPTRLSRLAVLFRALLVIPAWVVSTLLSGGIALIGFFTWVIVLVKGRMPQTLFDALAAALRYQTRLSAYSLLLTSAYPSGLFGDPSSHTAPARAEGAPEPVPVVRSAGSKRLVALVLALGAVMWVGFGVILAVSASGVQSQDAQRVAVNGYNELAVALSTFQTTVNGCSAATNRLACIEKSEPAAAAALDLFAGKLEQTSFPSGSKASATVVEARAHRMASVLRNASTKGTEADYVQAATPLVTIAPQLDAAVADLLHGLGARLQR
jgi:hypothetical protein